MNKPIRIIVLAIVFILVSGFDPNTPSIPPRPGAEVVSIIDAKTLRITTSIDIKKSTLIARKARLLWEIEGKQMEIDIIDARLAQFKD